MALLPANIHRRPVLGFGVAAFLEIAGGVERVVLLAHGGESGGLAAVDRQMGRGQRRLDAKRAAGGDFFGDANGGLERGGACKPAVGR